MRLERRVSGRPGADGAVVELVDWVVRFVVEDGCAGRGAIRRDYNRKAVSNAGAGGELWVGNENCLRE